MANRLFDALKLLLPTDYPLFCLTTYLCRQHRDVVLNQITRRLNAGQPLICISTQLMEAGVDLSFDCVVRDLAGLPSIIQAAGRCNRHGENSCRLVYLIECAGENLNALPEIYDGREITRALLAQLPDDVDLLSPQAVKMYYQRYYSSPEHQLEMQYPVSPKDYIATTMVDLLSSNRQGIQAFMESGHRLERSTDLCQLSVQQKRPLLPFQMKPYRCWCLMVKGRANCFIVIGSAKSIFAAGIAALYRFHQFEPMPTP